MARASVHVMCVCTVQEAALALERGVMLLKRGSINPFEEPPPLPKPSEGRNSGPSWDSHKYSAARAESPGAARAREATEEAGLGSGWTMPSKRVWALFGSRDSTRA